MSDQLSSPTYVYDLTKTIIHLFDKKMASFIQAIPVYTHDMNSEEYGAMEPRPQYLIMENRALLNENVNPLKPWREVLKEFFPKELYK